MKQLFLLVALLSNCLFLHAQNGPSGTKPEQAQSPKGDGKITGTVVDDTDSKPVEFATIALTDSAGKAIDGTVCDDKGKFSLNKIADGKYTVVISFIGFETKRQDVEISGKKNHVDLETVTLNTSAKVLSEVTVEGQKALVEERVDRTIYNAENDATTRGGDATDVLKRVPLLTVDLDGNVTLRGSANVRVLINNKPSTIMASSVADALKQIPAEQIKSVEVITSPSAKYDAEGTGGIINIITKKNTLEGATLNINSSAGIRGSNLGLNGNYRKGKLGISLGGWGRGNYNTRGAFENWQQTIDTLGNETINTQESENRNHGLFGNYNLGLDYDINKFNFLTGSVRFGLRNWNNFQDGLHTQTFSMNNLIASSLRDVTSTDNSGNIDVNFGYTRTYEKPQRELSVLALYSRNDRVNDFSNDILNESDLTISSRIKNENKSLNEEITVQLDYVTPISTNQLVEIGGKEILRKVSSEYQYFTAEGADGPFLPDLNRSLTNTFYYDQNVTSGYASYTYNTQKAYSFKGGVRYEYTTITANFQGEQEIQIPAYGVLVPSLNVSRKLKNGNMIKASYNRRIQRPSIQFLNPTLQAANPLNATVGNPNLDPEGTNNYEVAYSTFIKGTTINFSAFARNTNNAIQSVRTPIDKVREDPDTILTRYQNIGKEDAYGLNIFLNVNIGGKLMLNGGTDMYYAVLNNNSPNPAYNASNEGWVTSYRLFGGYNMKNGWGLQLFAFFRARQVQLQGFQGAFGFYSLSVKKDFKNKRGSIGVGAENFISPVFKIKNELTSPNINQRSVVKLYNTSFKINFSYTIGKMSFENQPRRRRRSISNDDLKDGGGEGGGGVDQPANGGGGQAPAARPQGNGPRQQQPQPKK